MRSTRGPAGPARSAAPREHRAPPGRDFLALTSTVQLDPARPPPCAGAAGRAAIGSPRPGSCSAPGAVLEIDATCGHRPRHHANDGPASAFVMLDDGSTIDVHVGRCTAPATPVDARTTRVGARTVGARTRAMAGCGRRDRSGAHGSAIGAGAIGSARCGRVGRVGDAWPAVAVPTGGSVPTAGGRSASATPPAPERGRCGSAASIDDRGTTRWRSTTPARESRRRRAASRLPARVRHARPMLRDGPPRRRIVDRPAYDWRGLHVDLARAVRSRRRRRAARRRRRLAQAQSAASAPHRRRGVAGADPRLPRAAPIGALARPRPRRARRCSVAAPSRTAACYTPPRSRRWVTLAPPARGRDRARDRPARPLLRRAGGAAGAARSRRHESAPSACSTSSTTSLNPGPDHVRVPRGGVRRARRPVPVAVAAPRRRRGAPGAWAGSPLGDRRRAARGAGGRPRAIEAAVHAPTSWRSCGERHRAPRRGVAGGGRVGRPAPGRRLRRGWKSAAEPGASAAAGYDVVAAPAERYYLDMAIDDDWTTPGRAGPARRLADVERSTRRAGWSDGPAGPARRPGVPLDRARPVGDGVRRARLPTPRRDRRTGWLGRIEGGVGSIAARSAVMPRLVPTRQTG